jgi:hypothetical protein
MLPSISLAYILGKVGEFSFSSFVLIGWSDTYEETRRVYMSFLDRAAVGIEMPAEANRASESVCHFMITTRPSRGEMLSSDCLQIAVYCVGVVPTSLLCLEDNSMGLYDQVSS